MLIKLYTNIYLISTLIITNTYWAFPPHNFRPYKSSIHFWMKCNLQSIAESQHNSKKAQQTSLQTSNPEEFVYHD